MENLKKFRESIKETINCSLRDIDIASNGGIELPCVAMISIADLYKVYQMLEELCKIEDVVGQPNIPCPVQSQNAISACRTISSQESIKVSELDFIQYSKD